MDHGCHRHRWSAECRRMGFETRVELRLGDGQRVWAQLPLPEVDRLALEKGQTVGVDLSRSRRIGWQLVGAASVAG